jgi:hypothetical protein
MVSVHTIDGIENELRQAEIITNLTQFAFDPVNNERVDTVQPYSIILSQDCDLLRDFEDQQQPSTAINGVLVFELQEAGAAKANLRSMGREYWRSIERDGESRYHLLSAVPPELDRQNVGLPELIIDFRRFYSLPPTEIYRQVTMEGGAKRRCRVESPFREHLQNRLGAYLQRVALPDTREPVQAQPAMLDLPTVAAAEIITEVE